MIGESKESSMLKINAEISSCRCCVLAKARKNTVPGKGSYQAKLVIVGEAPGASEDEVGEPFVGRSGKLLDKIIEDHGVFKRSEIFITNAVRCRPPGNRPPAPDEVTACKGFLYRQLDIVRPRVVLCLGSTATFALTGQALSLSRLRGRNLSSAKPAIVATYHPSYGLRMGDSVVQLMASDYALACSLVQED